MAPSARPLVISHAACAGHAPENTLAGLRLALHMGVDGIEVDVRASADGVPVLMHDATVDRTTDGQGEVSTFSLAQLRQLDAGAKAFDQAFGGEKVPTLAEALELTAGRALLVAEIKERGLEAAVLEAVQRASALDQIMFWSFQWEVIAHIRQREPRAACCLLVPEMAHPSQAVQAALMLGAQGLAAQLATLTATAIGQAHRRGLSVYAWTVDQPWQVRRLAAAGADGIVTNYPNTALSVLRGFRWGRGAGAWPSTRS